MAPPLEDVRVEEPESGKMVIVFSGEHDLATKYAVKELLDSLVERSELVVADFSGAQFVDSSILNVLLTVNEEAQARGHRFRVQVNTAAIVRRAFEISGMFDRIDCARTREDALRES